MSKFKIASAAALLMALVCLRVASAAPAIPPKSIGSDTIVVVHLDTTHFNPDLIKSAAKAVLGQNAAKADEAIAKFKEKFDKATATGVEAVTIVVGEEKAAPAADPAAPHPKTTPVAVYFQLKAGSDVEAVKTGATADMGPDDKAKAVFEQQGDYLVMHEKDAPLPTQADADREKAFTDAIGTISTSAVQVVFIPSAHVREAMLKGSKEEGPVKGLEESAAVLANAKWITVAATLGDAPNLAFVVNTSDAAGAKQLSDGINAALDDVKAKAADPNGNKGLMTLIGPLVGPLVEGLRPTTAETKVTVTLTGKSLASIGDFAANMGLLGGGPK